ncbi:hypothetical protein PIB30_063189 [Stylosanthes scabra]|uniref:PB1-like domain-containing protein n=1 Tax=Stylosanthes scabra TaxID=79078 RepID=A0ABU6TMP5_9FABA|nr:hypothetical protein [Stylosanthes scabra]
MEEDIYVPVLHYEGRFDRSNDGVLSYLDGNVKRFRPMDIDLLLLSDLEGFVKEVGFGKWEKLLWHDLADPKLDTGLHEIKDDADLNETTYNQASKSTSNSSNCTYRSHS